MKGFVAYGCSLASAKRMTIVVNNFLKWTSVDYGLAPFLAGTLFAFIGHDGYSFSRGERTAVCDKTFHLLQREPYLELFEPVVPIVAVPLETATNFDFNRGRIRHPRESKGENYHDTTDSIGSCGTADGKCC